MKNKIALITGGGTGIGRACALALAKDGWRVVIAGRRKKVLDETAQMAGKNSDNIIGIQTDVSQKEQVQALFDDIKKRFGRLDLLFNNVGQALPSQPFEDVSDEDWEHNVQTNINGTFYCSKAAFQLMKSQTPLGGRIINNGAPSAHVPRPNGAAFTVTKHAMTGFTKALNLEGRKYKIAVGQFDLGNVNPPGVIHEHAALQANGTRLVEDVIHMQSVADTFLLMANLPLDTNILDIMLMPTNMPYVGRG